MTQSLINKLTKFAEITEKDYEIKWNDSSMTIFETDSGRVVTSGSQIHCERYIEKLIICSLRRNKK